MKTVVTVSSHSFKFIPLLPLIDRGQTTVGTGPPDIVGCNSRLNVVQHSNIERPVLGNLLCYSIRPVMAETV